MMRTLQILALCGCLMPLALHAETLTPPRAAEDNSLAAPTSSVNPQNIIITVLAALIVWAAVQQDQSAKSG